MTLSRTASTLIKARAEISFSIPLRPIYIYFAGAPRDVVKRYFCPVRVQGVSLSPSLSSQNCGIVVSVEVVVVVVVAAYVYERGIITRGLRFSDNCNIFDPSLSPLPPPRRRITAYTAFGLWSEIGCCLFQNDEGYLGTQRGTLPAGRKAFIHGCETVTYWPLHANSDTSKSMIITIICSLVMTSAGLCLI